MMSQACEATFTEAFIAREQSVGLRRGQRAFRIDGKRPTTRIEYASRTPVVVFHPGDTMLPGGGGSERRRLLDRIALHLAPGALEDMVRYVRASRERQRALELRGSAARDLLDWESLMVTHGLAVHVAREQACARLSEAAERVFPRIAPRGLTLSVSYAPGAPANAEEHAAALRKARTMDLRRGSATVGPHRDDLQLSIGGMRVRGIASQGQQRLVVLALRAAEIEVVTQAKGVRPLLLLDDVSSELDRWRTAALFEFVGIQDGQIFLTTTRPELIDTSSSPDRDRPAISTWSTGASVVCRRRGWPHRRAGRADDEEGEKPACFPQPWPCTARGLSAMFSASTGPVCPDAEAVGSHDPGPSLTARS